MYRINQESLTDTQVEVKELIDNLESLSLFNGAETEEVQFKRDSKRRFLGNRGIREYVRRYVYYPELINPFVDIDGVDSTILISRYWRSQKRTRDIVSPGEFCVGLNFYQQMDGNGSNNVWINPLTLAVSGSYKGVGLFKKATPEQLTQTQSITVVSEMLNDLIDSNTPSH